MNGDASSKRLQNSLDGVLDQAVTDRNIVGGVLVVSLRGKTAYSRAVGFADREARRKTELDTLFRWAPSPSRLSQPSLWR